MLLEGLIYFLDCGSIVQISSNLKMLSMEVNYSDDMLLYFLDNDLFLNICKSWVNYLDDKSLLQPYLVKYSKDSEWVKLVLTFYPEIDYRHNNDKLLVSCCKYGHLEIVKWLTDNGANVRSNNYRSFQCACKYGCLETAKYLFNLIDNVEQKKECIHAYRNNALRWSANNGHLEMVKWLINNGANIRVDGYKSFQFACIYGHLEIAEYLLSLINTDEEKKLCVQSNDNYALRFSAKNDHLEMVKWLVNNGADIKVDDYQPFRYACENGHLETAKYLFNLIDDIEQKKQCIHVHDDHALIRSAGNGHLEVVKWLIDNGADVKSKDYEAFQYACIYGHLEAAKCILDSIDDIEEKKQCIHVHDDCALRWSATTGRLKAAEWLVNNGADVKSKDYEAFRCACEYGHLEIAEYLLDLINDIEEKNLCIQSQDNYALRWSATFGRLEVVEWLVNNGADVRSNNYEAVRFSYGRKVRDYLLDQLAEKERMEIIDSLN